MWKTCNPPGPLLPLHSQFTTTLGPRRVLCAGDRGYFQYENRRYYCEVLSHRDEPHCTRHGRRCTRRILTLRVLA